VVCNDASLSAGSAVGDPTEIALLAAAERSGMNTQAERARLPRIAALPFDSERRFMATLHAPPGGGTVLYVKGAPEVLLGRCRGVDRAAARREVDRLAADGQRVLLFAARRDVAPERWLTRSNRELGWWSNPSVYVGIAAVLLTEAAFTLAPFCTRSSAAPVSTLARSPWQRPRRSSSSRSPRSRNAGAARGRRRPPRHEAMSDSSAAGTPRGSTMTGQCASAATRCDTPPSITARSGP
jgi:hypothetical protein